MKRIVWMAILIFALVCVIARGAPLPDTLERKIVGEWQTQWNAGLGEPVRFFRGGYAQYFIAGRWQNATWECKGDVLTLRRPDMVMVFTLLRDGTQWSGNVVIHHNGWQTDNGKITLFKGKE